MGHHHSLDELVEQHVGGVILHRAQPQCGRHLLLAAVLARVGHGAHHLQRQSGRKGRVRPCSSGRVEVHWRASHLALILQVLEVEGAEALPRRGQVAAEALASGGKDGHEYRC